MKKSMLKRLTAALLAASVVAAMPLSASAAWKKTGDIWQWTENGQNATGWRWIGGAWYHFNASGDMTKGWLQENGTWYYLKGTGAMAQGWNLVNGKWYCMNANGSMRTGWVQTKGIWYFLAPNGDMQTGVIQVNGKTYCLDDSGAMKTGKVEIDGKTYNFGDDGAATGTAPKADKAFSTTSGSAVDVPVTTPSKPSYSGGGGGSTGGGSVTPDPDPTKDPASIDSASYADFDWTKSYGTVTIYTTGLTETDFSRLTAEMVVVKDGTAPSSRMLFASSVPTLVFGKNCNAIVIETPVKIESTKDGLKAVTVKTGSVEIAATVNSVTVSNTTGATVNVTGEVAVFYADKSTIIKGVGTDAVVATAAVTVDSGSKVNSITIPETASNVEITATGTVPVIVAEAAVEVTGTVEKVTVPSGASDVSITGTGTVKSVDANAPVELAVTKVGTVVSDSRVTVSGGTVTTIEASGNVVVSDGSVTDVVAKGNITVEVNKNDAVTNVSKTEGTTVNISGTATSKPTEAKVTAEAPDKTKITATKAAPEKGSIKNETGAALEYMDAEGEWQTIASGATISDLAPATYKVRVPANGEKAASSAVEVTVEAFTGFSSDVYYKDSVIVKNAWVTDHSKKYLTGNDGKALKDQWASENGKQVWLDTSSGENKGSFGLYEVAGDEAKLTGGSTNLEYCLTENGTYTVFGKDGIAEFPELEKDTDIFVRVKGGASENGCTVSSEKPSPSVKVRVRASAKTTSNASFGVVTSDDFDMYGKKSRDLGTGFAVNSKNEVTGSVYYLNDYTEWWDADNGKGYFVPLVIAPEAITDDLKISVAGKTFGKADLEKDGAYKDKLVLVYRVAKESDNSTMAQSLDVTVQSGNAYKPHTFTLDLSGLVKMADGQKELVATANGLGYSDINAAITAAASAENKTVTLMKDIRIDAPITVNQKGVTINGNGKTIRLSDKNTNSSAMFEITVSATVKNLTLDGENKPNSRGIYTTDVKENTDGSKASEIVLENLEIRNCIATAGGAIRGTRTGSAAANVSNVKLTVRNCTITANTASGVDKDNNPNGSGGAISFDNVNGKLTLEGCDIQNNIGNYYAGGIWVASTAEVSIVMTDNTIINNTLADNAATYECGCKTGQDLFINSNSCGTGGATVSGGTLGYVHVEADAGSGSVLTVAGNTTFTNVHGYGEKSKLVIGDDVALTFGGSTYTTGNYKWANEKWVIETESASSNISAALSEENVLPDESAPDEELTPPEETPTPETPPTEAESTNEDNTADSGNTPTEAETPSAE